MTDLFNNRELASAFWFSVFVIWAATKSNLRESFGQLLRVLFNKHIVRIFAQMTIYVVILIAILAWSGFWDSSNLKITIYWFVSAAIVMVFRSNQETSNPNYFKTVLQDNVNLVVLLEYVVNFHSFSLLVELAILPVVTIVVVVQAFSEGKKEYQSIQTPLSAILAIYLLSLLAHTVYQVSIDPYEFVKTGALADVLLPPILSIAFLPFMFFLLTYFAYGQAFSRIRFSIPEELLADARRMSFRQFRGNRLLLLRWAKIAVYTDIKNRDELVRSIEEVKYMKWREVHPSIVTFEHGWAPGNATAYLSTLGIVAGDYDPSISNIWTAYSDSLPLGGDSAILCNSVAYNIYGNRNAVRQLKLKLNVNEPSTAEAAHEVFLECCAELAAKALDRPLDPAVSDAILVGENHRSVMRERNVTVERHDWAGSRDKAYEVKFEICHPDFEPR